MKLKNLQMQFHGVDHSKHRITYVNEHGTECRETLCSSADFAQHVIDCLEATPEIRKELGEVQGTINGLKQLLELPESAGLTELFNTVEALELNKSERDTLRKAYNSNVKDWRELCGYFNLPVSTLSDVLIAIDTMRKERDDALERVTAPERHILHEINQSASAVLTKPLDCMADVYALVYGLATSATAPDTTQPQLSEIRYVLHGDIQPCSVLYSDDTTTLLRLDEGDIMCETDTIEWSDSVTYRCQELLRGAAKRSGHHMTNMSGIKAMAQLVRDERILLNDNGDDEFPSADEAYFREGVEQPCNLCGHVFDVDSTTCPMCNTIRTPKQER